MRGATSQLGAKDVSSNQHICHFCPWPKGTKREGFMLKGKIEVTGRAEPGSIGPLLKDQSGRLAQVAPKSQAKLLAI